MTLRLPIKADGYPKEASLFTVKHLFDLVGEWCLDIVGDRDLPLQEPDSRFRLSFRRIDPNQFHFRLPSLGDDEGFSLLCFVQGAREWVLAS
jgi:hypothetical protein